MNNERKTIMIVDDNATNLAVAKEMLKDDYKVYPIPSADILFDLLDDILPDLILLDVEMPVVNGYDVITVLKSKPATEQIPVIFLTARSDEESELLGLSLGAIDYVQKPFSAPLLKKRIENHLLAESHRKELLLFNNNLSEMVRQKTDDTLVLQHALLTTVTNMVEFRDDVTGGHVHRIQKYLSLLLSEMSASGVYMNDIASWDIQACASSSGLHDVGKIAISDAILNKPGKLTDEEFAVMKTHVNFGLQVIRKMEMTIPNNAFLKHALMVVAAHHERWDGFGYPAGLKGTDIPLEGRLTAIVDVYDALISKRPYKLPFSTDEARMIVEEGSGTQFDPALIAVFSKTAEKFAEIVRDGVY